RATTATGASRTVITTATIATSSVRIAVKGDGTRRPWQRAIDENESGHNRSHLPRSLATQSGRGLAALRQARRSAGARADQPPRNGKQRQPRSGAAQNVARTRLHR